MNYIIVIDYLKKGRTKKKVGLTKVTLSDNGPQFKFDEMMEMCKLLSLEQVFSSPPQPINNCQVEYMSGTLKSMLRRVTS